MTTPTPAASDSTLHCGQVLLVAAPWLDRGMMCPYEFVATLPDSTRWEFIALHPEKANQMKPEVLCKLLQEYGSLSAYYREFADGEEGPMRVILPTSSGSVEQTIAILEAPASLELQAAPLPEKQLPSLHLEMEAGNKLLSIPAPIAGAQVLAASMPAPPPEQGEHLLF